MFLFHLFLRTFCVASINGVQVASKAELFALEINWGDKLQTILTKLIGVINFNSITINSARQSAQRTNDSAQIFLFLTLILISKC